MIFRSPLRMRILWVQGGEEHACFPLGLLKHPAHTPLAIMLVQCCEDPEW